jgi:hypothetical protein
MPIEFPNTRVKSVTWSNYSGTIGNRAIPLYCTPEGGIDVSVLRLHGDAIRAILRHCFTQDPPARVRALGSTWSFSRIIEPAEVVIDPANFTYMARAPRELFTAGYEGRAAQGFTPMFIEGGTQIAGINRRLANDVGLALQTSGAGDGHRLAGCIATGTHGAALRIGALHDTVLGVYLVVEPDRAVFLQSGTSPFCQDGIANWLEERTGIPTVNLPDDDLFHAAQVSLGSLGFVFGVVVETVPLYRLRFLRFSRPFDDADVWNAVRTLNTTALHPDIADRPYHFDVIMHPYPPDGADPALYVTLMWKVSAAGVAPSSPLPGIPVASSDYMGIVAKLAETLSGPLTAPITEMVVRGLVTDQLGGNAPTHSGEAFPGEMFGPTSLPPGTGASTEIVVRQAQAEQAIRIVYRVLNEQKGAGRFLLGVLGIRFVPQSKAWLAMNANPMNCYIELPSIRNDDVLHIYREVWNALEQAGIAFTCHWGQLHGMNAERLSKYFGSRAASWKAAREQLLDEVGRQVFAASILEEVGLDS